VQAVKTRDAPSSSSFNRYLAFFLRPSVHLSARPRLMQRWHGRAGEAPELSIKYSALRHDGGTHNRHKLDEPFDSENKPDLPSFSWERSAEDLGHRQSRSLENCRRCHLRLSFHVCALGAGRCVASFAARGPSLCAQNAVVKASVM
jgi:hypothetical protein